jgi:hypothetical protein
LGIDSRKVRKKRRQKDAMEHLPDDVKRELQGGKTLLSYSEQMPVDTNRKYQ